jgi:glycosyltransferase involved in cell wall biosynthesis
VLEALACGLCIVSTNPGGIPYLLRDGWNALLVNQGDAGAMAAAVRRILTNPGLAESLSQNARRTAEQFDWSVTLPQWDDVFRSVTTRAAR